MNNRKLINIVKGDIKKAIDQGSYARNTERNSNIEFDTKNKQILLDGVPYSNPLMVETTYNELKTLRDNSQLVPGSFYRITDYECTTTQENTQSAGHKFDIILLALSEDSLQEEGWAIRNESNLYDVTFSDNVTKKCWIYFNGSHYNIVDDKTQLGDNTLSSGDITLNFSAKTASCPTLSSASLITENLSYNNDYFKNSNLNAWKVWYCLDNDKSRFAWADTTNGKGVIYRMIDEFNNDIKYDFKNIQFKRKLTDGSYDANGTETWCYTLNVWYNDMCQDASIVGNTLPNSWRYISGVYDNVFGYATAIDLFIEGANTFAFVLGNNVVLSFLQFSSYYSGIYSNTIGNDFYSNTIGDNFNSNIIGNYFSNNTIGNSFYYNTIGNDFYGNTIGNDFIFNTIGNSFYYNTIGNSFQHKNISTRLTYANYGNDGVELATKS